MKKTAPFVVAAICVLLSIAGVMAGSDKTDDLDHTRWNLDAIIDVDGRVAIKANTVLPLEFDAGQALGDAGCNRFFASYTLEGKQLSFGQIASTKKLCLGEAQQLENVLFKVLEDVTSFSIESEHLHLETVDGRSLIYRRN